MSKKSRPMTPERSFYTGVCLILGAVPSGVCLTWWLLEALEPGPIMGGLVSLSVLIHLFGVVVGVAAIGAALASAGDE